MPTFFFLRLAALFEGTSLILLVCVAVPLKYLADMPIWVTIIGPAHGLLFIAFVVLLLTHYLRQHLNLMTVVFGLIAAFIPFGTFVFKATKLKG